MRTIRINTLKPADKAGGHQFVPLFCAFKPCKYSNSFA